MLPVKLTRPKGQPDILLAYLVVTLGLLANTVTKKVDFARFV